MSKKSLFSASLLLAVSSLLSRGMGVWRDHLFATIFGTEGVGIYNLDTYYAAFRIPDMLYSILIYGTISVAFMPLFSEHLANKKEEEAWKFTSNVLNLMLLAFALVAGIIFIFAQPLMGLFVKGFSAEQVEQTAQLVRIMLLSPLFFSIAAIAIGVENSFQKFTAQAIAPVLYNLGIISGALLFGEKYGVFGLVWGVVLGAFLYMLVQVPGILKSGFRWFPLLGFSRKDTREMFTLMIPRVISLSALQVNLLVDTFIASGLLVGSLTVLNLAQNLQSLPYGIVSISVSITSFSLFTKYAAEKNWEQFGVELKKSSRMIFFLLIPSVAGMFLLRKEMIAVILEGGNFDTGAVKRTSAVLSLLLIGLIAQGMIPILVRAFFALKNTKLPLIISLIAMAVNVGLSFYLTGFMGVKGLALANAGGMWVNLGLLFFFLRRRFPEMMEINFVLKVVLATLGMGGLIYGVRLITPSLNGHFLVELVLLVFLTGMGLGAYLGLGKVLGLEESEVLFGKIGSKLKKQLPKQ